MVHSKPNIPVYQDVMFLFRFISFTGASTFVPYGEGMQNPRISTVLVRILQQITCLAIFLLLLAMSVFEFIQFVTVIVKMKNIGEVIPNIIWITSFPLAMGAQAFYIFQRPKLLKFFENWQDIHTMYSESNGHVTERQTRPRMVCTSVAMVIVLILDFPILPFLPSTYEPLAAIPLHTNNLYLTCALFGVSLFYAWNLSAASDLVPSMIYFHLALSLKKTSEFLKEPQNVLDSQTIENNCKNLEVDETNFNSHPSAVKGSQDSNQVIWQKGWLYYEAIRKLINESNSRFGSMLLLNHGAMFFVASSNVFSILRWYRGMSWLLLLVNGMNAVATILRFITTILLCSRLYAAGEHLQSNICRFLAVTWFRLKPDERQFFTAFLVRVQDDGIVASPLGLYPIRPSILLALLSLMVTYLIVLLQSSEVSTFSEYGNFTGLITGTRFYNPLNV
ncbi:hypothetical protein DAPPUDRAFT_98040 [Daphnia pulex]|uniref:Gustatory receptor n=1 Tax=Daphnia pulex TaxID=6669 RepID=E9G251_DAPPU|nr:hypothetical protein DAPPUDRAFT_98040 [Daphnia pulex]|eukprot:EFX86186.1 hypothetical protein DAPPUDRAFT_98040 [Daphnia pulex]